MRYVDKALTCQRCGGRFTFTANQQALSALKGVRDEPTCCPACNHHWSWAGSLPRAMRTIVCAACGKEVQVPCTSDERTSTFCLVCYRQQRRRDRHS